MRREVGGEIARVKGYVCLIMIAVNEEHYLQDRE